MNSNKAIKDIFNQFDVEGAFHSASAYGSGHINDTYLIQTSNPAHPDYILRKINKYVFKSINQKITLP